MGIVMQKNLLVQATVLAMLDVVGVAWARGDQVIEALKARYQRMDHIQLTAEWRTYRAPANADPRDRQFWKQLEPGIERDFDIEYRIARPWFQIRVRDNGRPEADSVPLFAWVDREMTQLNLGEGRPAQCMIVNHRNHSILRGKVFLTPVELEMFDMKDSFLDLLQEAKDPRVNEMVPGRVVVEFTHPRNKANIMRATFDRERDWAPLVYEQFTPGEGGRKPMSYLMDVLEVAPVAGSFIIAEAVVVNRNPNAVPETIMVSHYKVTSVKNDPAITATTIRLPIPASNVEITDTIRLFEKTIDSDGKIVASEKLNRSELEEQQRQWAITAEQGARAARERQARTGVFTWIVGGSALIAVGIGYLLFRRRYQKLPRVA